jgi:hypothetical protein
LLWLYLISSSQWILLVLSVDLLELYQGRDYVKPEIKEAQESFVFTIENLLTLFQTSVNFVFRDENGKSLFNRLTKENKQICPGAPDSMSQVQLFHVAKRN